jgi:hypothetical protein
MLISMRSTVVIDDEIFKQAKQRAAALSVTLSEVINQALRESLAKPPVTAPAFHMITFGNPKAPLHREPKEMQAVLDESDREALRR